VFFRLAQPFNFDFSGHFAGCRPAASTVGERATIFAVSRVVPVETVLLPNHSKLSRAGTKCKPVILHSAS
jgi:hypothetical protein